MKEQMQFPFLFKYYQKPKQKSCKNSYNRKYHDSGCYNHSEKTEPGEEVVYQKKALNSEN